MVPRVSSRSRTQLAVTANAPRPAIGRGEGWGSRARCGRTIEGRPELGRASTLVSRHLVEALRDGGPSPEDLPDLYRVLHAMLTLHSVHEDDLYATMHDRYLEPVVGILASS